MKAFITLSIIILLATLGHSQELKCNVKVTNTSRQNMQVDKSIFEGIETALTDFINGNKWTTHTFEEVEKIECSFSLNITEVNGNNYSGTLTLQSSRPIYNSDYTSPIYNIQDQQVAFSFIEGSNLEFNETMFNDNLTSIFAFYINMILAADYDSFSPLGGTPYLTKAQAIALNAQGALDQGSAMANGWKTSEKGKFNRMNRYWLIEQMISTDFEVFRMMNYEYHRLGLDQMHKDPNQGRADIIKTLGKLKDVYNNNPSSYTLRIYFNGKSNEIINIIKEHPKSELTDLVETLSKADIKNAARYDEIIQ